MFPPHSATLTWNVDPSLPSPLIAGTGYNVYRGAAPGTEGATPLNGTTLIQATTYVDDTVVGGQTYTYYVTAVDADGESLHSNEFTIQVPLRRPDAPTGLTGTAQ